MGRGRPHRSGYVKRTINIDRDLDRALGARKQMSGISKSNQIERALKEILG